MDTSEWMLLPRGPHTTWWNLHRQGEVAPIAGQALREKSAVESTCYSTAERDGLVLGGTMLIGLFSGIRISPMKISKVVLLVRAWCDESKFVADMISNLSRWAIRTMAIGQGWAWFMLWCARMLFKFS